MALATQSPRPQQPDSSKPIWRAPSSPARWFWLIGAALLVGIIGSIYLVALGTQAFPGPLNDPWRSFGIIAFLLVLITSAYSLRRRFVRGLPGKVQGWLWMHTWLGIAALLIALMHENFTHILYNYCANASCLTNAYGGTPALFALILLVFTGITGRLIDSWQARSIASDASTNGAGIVRAIEEHLLELEYTLERLSAGKSEVFKQYCLLALEQGEAISSPVGLPASEHAGLARAQETLQSYTRLARSLDRQQRARRFIRAWRFLHVTLAILALLIITFHASMELLINVFHVVYSR
jgi:hypothetical protein